MLRLRFLAPLSAVALFGVSFLLGQERTDTIVGRTAIPKPYSQLNLTPKQKNDMARIRVKYTAEIVELEQKIKDLKRQERREFEKLLTATQKTRLQDLRGGKSDDDDDGSIVPNKKKLTSSPGKK